LGEGKGETKRGSRRREMMVVGEQRVVEVQLDLFYEPGRRDGDGSLMGQD